MPQPEVKPMAEIESTANVTALRPVPAYGKPQAIGEDAGIPQSAGRNPPSPTLGEVPVTLRPIKGRDTTNALRQRRHRQRKPTRKTAAQAVTPAEFASVTPAVISADRPQDGKSYEIKADVTVAPQRHGRIDVAAYTAAIGLASVAAIISIKGMVQLFPGTPLLIIAMASMMEASKLVTAGWLAHRWRVTAWVWRLTLVALVTGLAVINATGVYAQLVAAHVGERGAATAAVETQDAALAARIEVAAHTVADLDRRLGQIDVAVEEAAKRGKTNTALAAMEGQRRARAGLVDERNREAATLAAMKAERVTVAAKGRQIETEATPIAYVAAVFGVADQETAIRWLIALMVLCCDPLAIALTAAATARRSEATTG
jgi:hypothetical protein